MPGNALDRTAREAVRRSFVAASTVGSIAPGISGGTDSQLTGSNGPTDTDDWAPYGLTGFTLLGGAYGFRVRAGEKDW